MTISPFTVIIVLVLGVLFFGKNLPAVAKQVGSSLLEFRKGLNEWKEMHGRSSGVGERAGTGAGHPVGGVPEEPEERFEALGTKFEPPSNG